MMECPECNNAIADADQTWRGMCNACWDKKNTCTVCGKLVEWSAVYARQVNGKEFGRGHKKCLDEALKGSDATE